MEQVKASIGRLEDLARALDRGEVDPSSVSASDAIQACLDEIRAAGGMAALDQVGDFLVAASALMHAKSRTLLPSEGAQGEAAAASAQASDTELGYEEDDESDEGEAGADEALIARLMQYRVFKEAARELAMREEAWRAVYLRDFETPVPGARSVPPEVGLVDLVAALRGVLRTMPDEGFRGIPADDLALEDRMEAVLSQLRAKGELTFRQLFAGQTTRAEVIAVFLALLELIRLHAAVVRQSSRFGEILIYPAAGGTTGGV